MKILHITETYFPPEIRVLKECNSLKEAGFKMHVLCLPEKNKKSYEIWEDIKIYRPKNLINSSKFSTIKRSLTHLSKNWTSEIARVIKRIRPDIVHLHDINLVYSLMKVISKEKVVIDLHENMPAAVEEYSKALSGFSKAFYKITHNKKRFKKIEKFALKKADLVLTVVEEAKQRVIFEHPDINSEKVVNIENLESLSFLNFNSDSDSFISSEQKISYVGNFGPHRGLETLIESVKILKNKFPKIKVELIGAKNNDYAKRLQDIVDDMSLNQSIDIVGWIPFEEVFKSIVSSTICAIPHYSNPHTDSTIPHKIYQYMLAKKPILVSSSAPLARVVNEAKCGAVFEAGSHIDAAEKISTLLNQKNELHKLGQNGYDYVVNKGFNWDEKSSLDLIKSMQNLSSKK